MNNLKKIRKEKNLTQQRIATIIGISQSNYAKYENEKLDIPNEILKLLANYFIKTTDYILGIERTNYTTKNNTQNFSNISGGINGIINGNITQNTTTQAQLTAEEQDLIKTYRELSSEKQNAIKELIKK